VRGNLQLIEQPQASGCLLLCGFFGGYGQEIPHALDLRKVKSRSSPESAGASAIEVQRRGRVPCAKHVWQGEYLRRIGKGHRCDIDEGDFTLWVGRDRRASRAACGIESGHR